jgi:hypothetical protein
LKEQALLRRAYEAFDARAIDGALALMHPDVGLAERDGGSTGARGHVAVRAYWTWQFGLIDSHVEPDRVRG